VLYELCVESGEAVVTTIQKRERRKWKPLPLNTVELQKIASRKLRLGAQDTMHRAEALYNQGFISYPRTETNKFTLTDDELKALANEHIGDNNYGNFAQEVVNGNMYGRPRAGTSDDKAHPPIHPIKAPPANMDRTDQQLYEIITRHFLASISRDAVGHETAITINIAGEEFTTKGLMISEENYLEVYIYDKWTDKNIPVFQEGERFRPTTLLMKESKTQAPPLLSESDLISLMDKNQIGTDATIATHIETIQKREYAIKRNNVFEPTDLGLALVQGYTSMGLDGLAKPNLRAKMEADMNSISRGNVSKDQVLQQNLDMYKNVFIEVTKKVQFMYQSFNLKFKSIGQQGGQPTEVIQRNLTECGNCQNMMDLKKQDERVSCSQTLTFLDEVLVL
jgi:DNA topoisomerase-3